MAKLDSSVVYGYLQVNSDVEVKGDLKLSNSNTVLTQDGDNLLRLDTDSGYLSIGPSDATACYFTTDVSNFTFNKDIYVNTDKVWHEGNDGTGSTLDADLLDGQEGTYYLNWNNLNNVPTEFIPIEHGNDYHSSAYITAADVTFETLNNNSDVGTGASQVAKGDHDHDGTYLQLTGGDIAGSLSAHDVTVDDSTIDTNTTTLATETQTSIASFDTATYSSAKVLVQATRGTDRHISELLVVHDGTSIYATEYGTVFTSASLFEIDVDINSGDARILATGSSATSTTYKVFLTEIGV